MFMKRTRFALLVLAATAVAAGGYAAEHRGPRISVEQPRFDFGTVRPGAQPEHVFEIKNVGDEVLEIQQVLPS